MMYSTKQGHIYDCLPYRYAAIHFVFNAPILRYPLALMQNAVGKHNRIRFLCHYGTDIEVQYALQGYGITCSRDGCLPIDTEGNLHTEYHKEYINQLQRREEGALLVAAPSNVTSNLIETPTPNDILMGNGKFYSEHPGNIYLQQLCESPKYLEEYRRVADQSLASKALLNQVIVKHIKEQTNGRFIKKQRKPKRQNQNEETTGGDQNDGSHYHYYWIEAPDSEAWAKLTRIFRKLVK